MEQKNPVLLVHGIFRPASVFNKMSAYLTNRGWEVYALNMRQYSGIIGLDLLARQVADYVEKTFSPHQAIDLVGLSMGGIVSRYYVQRLGGIERVQRFITIGSPHFGTEMAYLLPLIGWLQMRPGSVFLEDLNRDLQILNQLNFTSIWTAWDGIIVPASSSRMPVGKEIKVPVLAHAMLVRHIRSLQAVVEALSEPVKV